MDIALCALEGSTLHYAGAYNPLWIIRGGELLEMKGDKQPIGKYRRPQPFTTHRIALEKGDAFYIFSDGFQDQFGGENDKKFGRKRLKALLLSIQDMDMPSQMKKLEKALSNWKGETDQVDDICMIGVRV
jgi:serine phosphatase RsbU (regulator of sigma subunit)